MKQSGFCLNWKKTLIMKKCEFVIEAIKNNKNYFRERNCTLNVRNLTFGGSSVLYIFLITEIRKVKTQEVKIIKFETDFILQSY